DRGADSLRTNRLDQLPAVEPGEHQIEHADVRLLVAEPGETLVSIADPDGVESRGAQVARHPLGDHLVVLDDEHLRHGCHYRVRVGGDGSMKGEGVVKGW